MWVQKDCRRRQGWVASSCIQPQSALYSLPLVWMTWIVAQCEMLLLFGCRAHTAAADIYHVTSFIPAGAFSECSMGSFGMFNTFGGGSWGNLVSLTKTVFLIYITSFLEKTNCSLITSVHIHTLILDEFYEHHLMPFKRHNVVVWLH